MKLGKTRKLKVLFIVDTKDNLPQTRSETRTITSMLGANNIKVAYDILEGKKATYSSVRNYIRNQNLDIVHVAAHAEFDETNPRDSGIVVNDGLLRTKDIYNDVVKGPPSLVFMNACESAKTIDSSYLEKYEELSGLAFAFLDAGALSYIGTICRINDRAASQIAISFYKKLLTGSSVGQSMQAARKEFFDEHREDEDLSWLAFRLYGDPNWKRDLIAEAIMDADEKVKEYVNDKKKRRQHFTIIDVARDLNISVSEARHILSRL
jgi:CHAT domain-containing protein